MTSNEIIRFLISRPIQAGLVDKLKIRYRPVICPFEKLLSYSKDKTSACDIGCGSGQFCALIARFTSVKRIMGIEINQTLINNAHQMNDEFKASKSFTFEVFDGVNIPDEVGEYEIVYLIDVFHHIPMTQQALFMKQLHRKMRRGATLVFKDIDGGSPLVIFNKLHDIIFSQDLGREMPYGNGLRLLKEIGFTIQSSFRKRMFVYPHYFIICSK